MGTILFGLGTLAIDAGARNISFTITRDDSGRPWDLFCAHDGRAPDEATLRSLLGAAGAAESRLNLLPPRHRGRPTRNHHPRPGNRHDRPLGPGHRPARHGFGGGRA